MTTRTEPRRLFARMSLAAYSAVLGVAVCGGLLASSVAQANTPSPYATVAVCPGGCSWWGMFAEQDKAQPTTTSDALPAPILVAPVCGGCSRPWPGGRAAVQTA